MTAADDLGETILQRRALRRNLLLWCQHALAPQGLVPAAHHRLLIGKLEAIANGTAAKRKLMVLMPPGSAKTMYGSYLFPPWMMARPDFKVLAASHSSDRAAYVSRHAQRFMRENELALGTRLDKEAVGQWSCTNGSEYRAAGVLEGIAGTRADLGLIDDPVKSREVADSATYQEKIWDWYWSDFFNRLRPGASQVLIMTRWSEGDLGGRLEEGEGDQWDIVRLPAVAEGDDLLGRKPGEMLWADDSYGFGAKLIEDRASYALNGRTRDWSAMYQQRPVPESGDYFRKEWLRPSPTLPDRRTLRVYGGSDFATTEDGGDWTVHLVVGIDPTGRMWVLDLWRGQENSMTWIQAFCDLVIQWKPIGWAVETGQIKASLGPFMDMLQRQRQAFVARHQFPTRGDKSVRAQSIRGRMALDGLYYAASAPWRMEFEREVLAFPAGKHDDQVDAAGLVGQLLDKMVPGAALPGAKKPVDSWDRAFSRVSGGDDSDWKAA